tara:strand:+ start:1280 stop:1807 length:528 start_codon:yes stop_codon:yes gene_type:complete
MKKFKKNKGIIFWITGLSGSGKTTIAKKITPDIKKLFGPTIVISGDDLRKIFKLRGYSSSERLKLGYKYSNLLNYFSKQKINVVFAVIGLFNKLQSYNKKTLKNYVEIYLKTNIKNLTKSSKKKHYRQNSKFVWGKDLRAEFPKNPDIVIKNDFNKSTNEISKIIIKKIKKMDLK